MGELSHIVSFVELGRIDFINPLCIYVLLLPEVSALLLIICGWESYAPIIALNKQPSTVQFLDYPASHKGIFGVFKPDVSLSREVVFPFDSADFVGCILRRFGGYELGCKCASWCTDARRIGAQAGGVAPTKKACA